MYQSNMKSRSNCLNQVFSGAAQPCGSGCWQDRYGSQWFGTLPEAAFQEIVRLINEPKTTCTQRDTLLNIARYCSWEEQIQEELIERALVSKE